MASWDVYCTTFGTFVYLKAQSGQIKHSLYKPHDSI